ncbi:MAG: hypothetical protein ACI8SE_001942 [Bacteroidia bacterium]|jgi:hypothetical protein
MKHILFFITASLFWGASSAQINVDNYRAIEYKNWSSNQVQVKHQLNQLKAQWATGNDVTMDINLLMNVEATSYTAIFNVRQIAKTSLEVNTLLNDRIVTFKKALSEIGIEKNDVIVEVISQVPIYGLKTFKKLFSTSQNEVPIGFELHKNITIIFKNYDALNDIVFEASKSEIYDLVKVDYFAENPYQYYDTMRQILTSYIHKLETRYDEIGLDLDSFDRMVSEKTAAVYPIARYTPYSGLTRMSYDELLEKNQELSVPVRTIVSPSMYYDYLPFDNFDVILHPKVIKPSIQYTMNMKIRFTQKPKVRVKTVTKTEVEKKFFMITEDGQVKLIDVIK